MKKITFVAEYNHVNKGFRVELVTPERRFVQFMSADEFLRWADRLDVDPLKIAGVTIKMNGNEGTELLIIKYFQRVADSYRGRI